MSSERTVEYSSKHSSSIMDPTIEDIDRDKQFLELFKLARPFTMTSKEVMYGLYQAAVYVNANGLEGDFVECGVWRGGSSLLAALTFRRTGRDRKCWLYDTFQGMTAPSDADVDIGGHTGQGYIAQYGDDGRWCYADLDEVRGTFDAHGLSGQVRYVVGDITKTITQAKPETICLLRLDTDWYESTKCELEQLYPLLVPGGVIIIDDYGHWQGSRQAVDEYFAGGGGPLLNRTSYAVRTAIKPQFPSSAPKAGFLKRLTRRLT